MSTLEDRLVDELQRQADGLPATSGDLGRVRRVGGRWLLATRVASVTTVAALVVAAVAVSAMLQGGDRGLEAGGQAVFEDGYALSEYELAALMVECLQNRGLDVVQSGRAIDYDNRVVSHDDFDLGSAACQTELRQSGFLLPGDNPEHLQVLYAQYEALARCYRDAGIEISDPPSIADFIDARQAGIPSWSPQQEATRQVGRDKAAEAERGCALPTPNQFTTED